MIFEKINDATEVICDGRTNEIVVRVAAGGHMVRSLQYMAVVTRLDEGGGDLLFGLRVDHGPTGKIWAPHSTPIPLQPVGERQTLLVGDAESNRILGEWLRPVGIISGVHGSRIRVELFEMRKPF